MENELVLVLQVNGNVSRLKTTPLITQTGSQILRQSEEAAGVFHFLQTLIDAFCRVHVSGLCPVKPGKFLKTSALTPATTTHICHVKKRSDL